MTVSIYDDNSKIVLGSVNYNRNVEWQYTGINIDPEVVFKVSVQKQIIFKLCTINEAAVKT